MQSSSSSSGNSTSSTGSMRIMRRFDTTKCRFPFQEDVVRYGAMTPGVHPGQTRIDLSANLVPRTRDGSSYTISLLYYQRIYTASRCSRFATPAICLSSAELTDVEKQSGETEAQPSSGSSSSRSNKDSNVSVSSNRSRSK